MSPEVCPPVPPRRSHALPDCSSVVTITRFLQSLAMVPNARVSRAVLACGHVKTVVRP